MNLGILLLRRDEFDGKLGCVTKHSCVNHRCDVISAAHQFNSINGSAGELIAVVCEKPPLDPIKDGACGGVGV